MNLPNPHGAMLAIDAAAIAHNWRLLSSRIAPAECAAVVKANAYGLGIETVVPVLARAGCCTFFTAHLEEGFRVRKAAPTSIIYVLNGMPPGSEPLYQINRLRPVLGTISEVGRWKKAGGGPSALHVDTGMNRLGLSLGEAKTLSTLNEWESIGIEVLMSHLVSSEEPGSDMNMAQITCFNRVKDWFGDRIKRRSLANSSAHFLPEPPIYELTRPGYAIYGGNPTPDQHNPMKPVIRLEAQILQIRHIEPGESVGYNAQWTAKRPSRIATISLGYGDGWLRSMSGADGKPGGAAMMNGKLCPFVGRISMDLITVDVTDCPIADVSAGQRMTLIGDGISVDDVAVMAGTNGYEILTSLGERYQRRIVGV
ncbi:MAG: alanine racemase [Methylocystis sp.]|nr:alanine racemase [Methylocystis sp.]MCA3584066.1 alanine racemase [Methylocystis sp.]MCA3588968.1 alanine racemase [Methylocystis sp.]MCA3591186.1 alanine racemase [Methylocystis sp.]